MILVRHGQSEFNVVYSETRRDPGIRDPGLTPLGRRQAAATAEALRAHTLHTLIASPYRRAIETARIVGEALGLTPAVAPEIGERAAFTCDIGTRRSTLAEAWPDLQFDHLDEEWWPRVEESEASLDARSLAFRARMAAHGAWRGVAVITHWGFIRALTGHRVGNCAVLRFDPRADHPGGGAVVSVPDVC